MMDVRKQIINMNARLKSIGFYLTCLIFFGFQSKSDIKVNTRNPLIVIESAKSNTAGNKISPVSNEEKGLLNLKSDKKKK